MEGLNPDLTRALHGVVDAALGKPGLSEQLYAELGHGNWKKLLQGKTKRHIEMMDEVIKAKAKGLPTALVDETPTQLSIANTEGVDPQLIQAAMAEEPNEDEIRQGEAMATVWMQENNEPEAVPEPLSTGKRERR